MRNITDRISDILIQRPTGFDIGGRHFYLYPVTLGKSQLVSRLLRELEYDEDNARCNANVEMARIMGEHLEECLRIIAYSTLPGDKCLNNVEVEETMEYLRGNAEAVDIMALMSAITGNGGTDDILSYYGIDKELAEYNRIVSEKEDKGTYTFCAKSIYGTMISPLAEKYGWTLDYILWHISLDNVRLLLADAQKTIILTEEERKRIHPKQSKDIIKADDPKNFERILNMRWE